jgi:hypothetical protein
VGFLSMSVSRRHPIPCGKGIIYRLRPCAKSPANGRYFRIPLKKSEVWRGFGRAGISRLSDW